MNTYKKPLTRSTDKRFAGVIGGIADYFDVDRTLARIVFVFIMVFTGFIPAIIFYFLGMIIVPKPADIHNNYNNDDESTQSSQDL